MSRITVVAFLWACLAGGLNAQGRDQVARSEDGMTLAEALAAPRVHPTYDSTFAFSGISMETSDLHGWTARQVEEVRKMGFEVTPSPRLGSFGRVHAIRFLAESGVWVGVADPDLEGAAYGPGR